MMGVISEHLLTGKSDRWAGKTVTIIAALGSVSSSQIQPIITGQKGKADSGTAGTETIKTTSGTETMIYF